MYDVRMKYFIWFCRKQVGGQLICQHLANTNNTTNMYRYLSNVQVLAIQLLNCQHLYKFFSCQHFILCEHLQCKINFSEDCLKCETLQGLPVHIWSESNLVIFEILEVLNTILSSSEWDVLKTIMYLLLCTRYKCYNFFT